jgi:diaminohydroxyphosphoribosylaminopyrimidine deaminase/5-amino-6-(5-phosphoribosylamino)uracil reductase
VIGELGRRQILNLMMEAGATINGAALTGGLVDKMFLFYAPTIMGERGVPLAQMPADWFSNGPALSRLALHALGRDFAVEGYFHDVYGDYRTQRED